MSASRNAKCKGGGHAENHWVKPIFLWVIFIKVKLKLEPNKKVMKIMIY